MHLLARYFNFTLVTLIFIVNFFIIGCSLNSSSHDSTLKPNPFGELTYDSSWYEDQLQVAIPEYNYDWQILLARSYSKENDIERAFEVVSQLRQAAITPLQGNQADIIEAQLQARKSNYQQAYLLLTPVNTLTLPQDTLSFYYVLKGNIASKLKKNTEAAQNFLNASKLYKNQEQINLYQRALDSLEKSSNKEIYKAFKQNNNKIDRGFFEYALIQKNKNQKAKERQMRRFEHKYNNHPVLNLTSKKTQESNEINQNTNTTIAKTTEQEIPTVAVFLPLTGKYAEIVGNPTKIGIINAYKDRGVNVNIKFYDTATNSISQLYTQALADNTKVIIGPIIKEQINELITLNPEIPVIALNEGTLPKTSKIFYLTLAPENDALNAVNEITKDNLTNPLIIAPNNNKGKRISLAFNKYWVDKHSYGVSVCYFTDVNTLKNTLNNCYKQSQSGFDAAYIYGTANEASIIKEFSKQVTKQIPMFYVGSKSNNGVLNNSALNSLNGMKIGDQPWLLKDSTKKNEIVQVLPKANGDTLRCFALGYDSLNLALGLSNLIGNNNEMISGLSGNIYIDRDGNTHRDLLWETIGSK
jgi:outer membrane PBP1 activator LpoA protein